MPLKPSPIFSSQCASNTEGKADVVTYVEAVVRCYNLYSRRETAVSQPDRIPPFPVQNGNQENPNPQLCA